MQIRLTSMGETVRGYVRGESVSTEPARQTSFLPSPRQLAMAYEEGQGQITSSGLAKARGVGRPAGSQNKRTKKISQYFVHKYGDPIDIAGNIITTPIEVLTAMIRQADMGDRGEELDRLERLVDKLALRSDEAAARQLYRKLMSYMSRKEVGAMEVAEWWRKIFQDAFTYVHGRQPTSIEVAAKVDAFLLMDGINMPTGVPAEEVAAAIEKKGLDAIDFEGMKLAEDAEFEEVEGDAEGQNELPATHKTVENLKSEADDNGN